MSYTHVQGNVGSAAGGASSVQVVLGANPTTGNMVCVAISTFNATLRTLNSVQDSNLNSYTITTASPSSAQNSTAGSVWLAYLLNAPANATKTITATFSASNSGSSQIWADEFSTTATTVFEYSTVGSGTGATTGFGAPTYYPLGVTELIYGAGCASNSISTCGNWTQSGGAVTSGNDAAYVIGGGLSPIGMSSWTLSGTNSYDTIIMGFSQNPAVSTPTTTDLVQSGSLLTLPSTESVSAGGQFQVRLPNPTISGNCLVLGLAYSTTNSPTITITDDGSNTWNLGKATTDTTNHITVALYYALNIAASTKTIHVSPSTSTNFISTAYAEFANIATSSALDGSNGAFNATTGTAIAPGSFTPAFNNDKIIQWAFATQQKQTGSWTPQSGFSLIAADALNGFAMQYQIQSTAAAINPTLTQVVPNGASQSGWATVAIGLKQATSGGLPAAGIHVDRVQHFNTFQEVAPATGFQLPSSGNLLVLSFICGATWTITGVADSAGNTWTQVGSAVQNSSNCQIFYAKNASVGDALVVQCTMSGSNATGSGGTFMTYSISGASSSPLDASFGTSGQASATGNDTTSGASAVTTLTATPSGQNEVIIYCVGIDFDSVQNTPGPSGANFLSATYTGQQNLSHSDENNGFAVYYNGSSTAAQTWTFTHDQINQTGVGLWASAAAAFLPAGATLVVFEDDSFNPSTLAVLVAQSDPIISVW